ncbi:pyridoxal phosphate-dependent decarboxylase family protein [Fodinibius salsisoli]|uniref:Aminotransferase class V-fold PLP-dependent enzyme n=1 Tax=Fodinibius salsisoli TaxID=2820877 RepID=A0ABT3PLA5_9BACT|nr:aminotransferase class V-fold PLP-dependent enzyme [Fodinibius salsisoli]MCW9706697.1 aminotransferase class V-fold PLP-dependent enzyme [Fodinibius salsisoli]
MEKTKTTTEQEIDLDPQDWNTIRELGHQIIEDMVDYLKDLDDQPVWKGVPADVKENLKQAMPQGPSDPNAVYQEFKKNIFPYPKGNIHPRFFGWVEGNGTALGALSELLASVMNPNVGIGEHSAMYVERQVLDWCKQLLGYPSDSSGILLSGASMANITALLVARNTASDAIKAGGVDATDGKLTAYCSSETHNCIVKAMEVIGLGHNQLREIPVDERYQMKTDALKEQIIRDQQEGYTPFCIIGNAGTVNTGAIDPMDELLTIAREFDLWFHVDGAFGALAKMVPAYEDKLRSLEQADSIAFDLHKWMYMPYEVGCVLVRNAEIHRAAFTTEADYLTAHDRGLAAGPETFSHFGMELSRGFKALKVWMSLKEHGIEKYRKLITQNITQASYLGSLVKENPNLELMAGIPMNIVCYRFNPGQLDGFNLNRLNKELLMRLHESGVAAPTYTFLEGQYVIRVSITNHRTKQKDLIKLIETSVAIGEDVLGEAFLSEEE